MRESRLDLINRWLTRITERVQLDPNSVFPSEELLDHVPLLVDGIASCIENPALSIGADAPVIAKAMELGALRHSQGFDEYQILKEFEILGGVMFAFLTRTVRDLDQPCENADLLVCSHRLFNAITLIQQATIVHYQELLRERVKERESRLRGFNQALSHEMKNRLGATMGAAEILALGEVGSADERNQILKILQRNLASMRATIDNLVELSRLDFDARQARHVPLRSAVAESARQLRSFGEQSGVRIEIGEDFPVVEVGAAAIELCLTNLISNAIKYHDRSKSDRWVRIAAEVERVDGPPRVVVRVTDNGLGVPLDERPRLFEQFFRATHEHTGEIEGTGLGLSIVRETAKSLGGSAWAEFKDGESIFAFSIPSRRGADAEVTAPA
ncbi:MAG: HAMP domain-containing histidine kinase [Gemmatimonadaceae bacterium]|nr:HAMP domain-containing histidine kinase [Gemmatimonadaceae bacterium]